MIGNEPNLVEVGKKEGGKLKAKEKVVLSRRFPPFPPTTPSSQGLAMVLLVLLLLPLLAFAYPAPHLDSSDSVDRALPSRWYHDSGHPVEQLFKRQNGGNPTDGVPYAEVGSQTWAAGFPDLIPDPAHLPQEWVNALNATIAAGKIPDVPVAVINGGGSPVYPSGVDPNGPLVCSGFAKCRNADDIWDAPNGVVALSFDDGPYLVSAHPSSPSDAPF